MTAIVDGRDLYLVLEIEVRTPKEPLLVDAFLPPPETIPSSLRRPEPPRPATTSIPDAAETVTTRTVGEEEASDPKAARPRRRPSRRAAGPEKSLEEEIAEFMSRSNNALAPDSDPDK